MLSRLYRIYLELRYPNVQIHKSAILRPFCIRKIYRGTRLTIGEYSTVSSRISFEKPNANLSIGHHVFLGIGGMTIAGSTQVGNYTLVSWGCTISDHDSHSLDFRKRRQDIMDWRIGKKDWSEVSTSGIRIEDDCWLGFNVAILKGVTINRGTIIAAGSIVTKDTEPFSLYAGVPARKIRSLRYDGDLQDDGVGSP